MADDISSEERRVAHRRGHSLPMHVRAREDVQSVNSVDFSGSVVGQSLRQAVDGLEGFWPESDAARAMVTSPIAVSPTPANVLTVSLPDAGTYALEATFMVQSGTLAANRVATFSFAHPGQGACAIGWAQGASVSTANGFGYGATFGAALPAIAFASTQDNVYSSVRCWGELTVSVGGNLTVAVAIDGDTASCLAGSFLRLRRRA